MIELGIALRHRGMPEDYRRLESDAYEVIKLGDFAKEFAAVYAS